MESEFTVQVDGEAVRPEDYWREPGTFIAEPMLRREGGSAQLPTGGAVLFDDGVLEVATPAVDLAPGCASRAVRSLFEQIAFVRGHLTNWSAAHRHRVRLGGFSTHYNVSCQEAPGKKLEDLARLLAHLLPVPVAFLGANRRSTGVGVRPRSDRIEVTADFTPDPGLMIATATFILGVVRGVGRWTSWNLDELDEQRLPTLADVRPGKHTSRRGFLVRDYDFPRSPFTTNVDARVLRLRDGRSASLRALARELFWRFRSSIRELADPIALRLLAGVLDGRSPSMLELPDRPASYDDVGRCKWGSSIPELAARSSAGRWQIASGAEWSSGSFADHVMARHAERQKHEKRQRRDRVRARGRVAGNADVFSREGPPVPLPRRPRDPASGYRGPDRREDEASSLLEERRARPGVLERRIQSRDAGAADPPRELSRSTYEEVFLRLGAGRGLLFQGARYRPIGIRGWSEAVFEAPDGTVRTFTIDALRLMDGEWAPLG